MRQKMYQQFVYKVESGRILGSENRDLIITPREARLNNELISLADSNVLRSIDKLNGVDRAAVAEEIGDIRREICRLRETSDNRAAARKRVGELYARLDELQLQSDYLMVVMSKPSDFDKLNEGFFVNNVEFRRLVGTPNGVKQSVVVYCPVVNKNGIHVHGELNRRMNGGRDENKPLVPAKFEAYKALACSASVPVSEPRDILVVDDFVLSFESDFTELRDAEDGSGEPVMTEKRGEFELNASDGFGLMCPALAERWSKELELDYTAGGMCIRNLFCKGMSYAFDFHEFARRYYDGDTITDVWGGVHNISDVEIILPVSVVKLWDSYPSLERYLECCREYDHGFAVTKVCEKELENERTLNYQFIQSYDLTDDEIKELVRPSVDEIKETVCGDADKTLLYLRGACGKNYDFDADTNYLAKAIMIDRRVAKDPHTITVVGNMLKKRIDDLKIGRVKVHGNYSVIGCDPFAFCQYVFGCDVPDNEKGLLKAGEMYSKYWVEGCESKRVVCFRAPMSVHANIRAMNVVRNEDIDLWYRYMPTVNIINCHDTFYSALNGADNDGDAILVTDNEILLRNTRDVPAIVCVQKKAEKHVITDELLARSNKLGFGDEIGAITNRITSMYDLATRFERSSEEYRTLDYRIKCGQLLQQACIDKVKGIISNPMPKEWYDYHSLAAGDDDDEETRARKEFNRRIVAEKKPYFMIYIYPALKKEYREFLNSVENTVYTMYGVGIEELAAMENKTEQQEQTVEWYRRKLPVFDGTGVMNRLCHYVEREFDGYLHCVKDKVRDYRFGELFASENYKKNACRSVMLRKLDELLRQYNSKLRDIALTSGRERVDVGEIISEKIQLAEQFKRDCAQICVSAETICDCLLKLCYSTEHSKKFVWDMCGAQIVENLLNRVKGYSYFIRDNDGCLCYGGVRYGEVSVSISEEIA